MLKKLLVVITALAMAVSGLMPAHASAPTFVNAVSDIAVPMVASTEALPAASDGTTRMTVTGSGFASVSSVTIGGVAATSLVVDSPTQIRFTAPARPNGSVQDLVITNTSGSLTKPGWIRYFDKELYLVADIVAGAAGSTPFQTTLYNDKLYFEATNGTSGRELFSFDGVSVQLAYDFVAGSSDGIQSVIGVFNNKLLVIADNGSHGWEPYLYDGTTMTLLANVNGTSTNSVDSQFSSRIVEFQGNAYFECTGCNPARGYVWNYSNNTVTSLSAAFAGYSREGFLSPVVMGGNLYFISKAPGGTNQLTKFDGTTFTELTSPATDIVNLGVAGNKLVYSGRSVNEGQEPWVYDGSTHSLLANLSTTCTLHITCLQSLMTTLGNKLLFSSIGDGVGRETWVYDGTSAPTLLADLNPGTANGQLQSPAVLDGKLYFAANTAALGTEAYVYDGTTYSLLGDLNPGSATGATGQFAKWGGAVYLSATTAATGSELYAYGINPQRLVPVMTYDANTGSGSATYAGAAGAVTLHSGTGFSKAGMTLLGWDSLSTATTPTYSLGASYTHSSDVTLFAIWGANAPQQVAEAPRPVVDLPGGYVTGVSGENLTLGGDDLDTVAAVEVDTAPAEIVDQSQTSLEIELPELEPGLFDLTLTSGAGRLTLQDGLRIEAGKPRLTSEAQALLSVWTKRGSANKVKFFAKNPVGVGKVQFFVDGKEVAWVNAVDETDPKLTFASGYPYLVRTFDLLPGKNRVEIRLDGERVWRATYANKG